MLNSIARASGLRTQSSRTISIPAPIGGWNARDSLGAMAIEDAVTLTNWWPGTNSVVLRYGYTQFATGITGQVESVIAYSGVTANKLFAAATTKIYNVTAGGAAIHQYADFIFIFNDGQWCGQTTLLRWH
jgi:hypothetical protein